MKRIYALILVSLFTLAGCSTTGSFHHPYASGHYTSTIETCVPYARRISGINLYGDAYKWWQEAPPHYKRGNRPHAGAVLVLKRTSRMRSGHVAVVRQVLSARYITVTHSNWGSSSKSRHIIYDSMLIEDVSLANDWSQVRFWNDEKNVMGSPYAAYGFIYP